MFYMNFDDFLPHTYCMKAKYIFMCVEFLLRIKFTLKVKAPETERLHISNGPGSRHLYGFMGLHKNNIYILLRCVSVFVFAVLFWFIFYYTHYISNSCSFLVLCACGRGAGGWGSGNEEECLMATAIRFRMGKWVYLVQYK